MTGLLLAVVFTFISGLLAIYVDTHKDLPPPVWWFWGALTGILGTAIALLVK